MPTTKKGGTSLITPPDLTSLAVPFGLMLAKQSAEHMIARTASASPKKSASARPKSSSGKKSGGASTPAISELAVPFGLMIAKSGAESIMTKKGGAMTKKGGAMTTGGMTTGGMKMKMKKDMSCGVNPSTGRCKKGMTKDKDMCDLNKKTNRCVKDKYTEAKNYGKVFGTKKPRANKKGGSSCGNHPHPPQ